MPVGVVKGLDVLLNVLRRLGGHGEWSSLCSLELDVYV